MKIALCLHGLFNSTTDYTSNGLDGFEYISKNILTKGDVDVYIHSWEVGKENDIVRLYKPKSSTFEQQKDFSHIIEARGLHTLSETPRPITSVVSHIYSVTEAVKLALHSGFHYDIVIKF